MVLVGILGTGPASERAIESDDGVRPLVQSLTAFPSWSSDALVGDGDLNPAIAGKVVALVILIFLLAFLAGRAESGLTAFLAGWGGLVVACAVAGAAFYVIADVTAFDGALADEGGGALAPLVDATNAGAVFAFYTGWVVGAAVAVTRRSRPADIPAAAAVTADGPAPSSPAPPPPTHSQPSIHPAPTPRTPVATWPPMPAQLGTVPPSPAWAPPKQSTPLPAVALPRREGAYTQAASRDRTASGLPRRPSKPVPNPRAT